MRPRSAAARRGWWLVAVFVLAAAVVGMHSMGAGHHGVPASVTSTGHQMPSAEDRASEHQAATSDAASQYRVADVAAPMTPAQQPWAHVTVACLGCETPGGAALGAMCLAVISSLLALTLLSTLRRLGRAGISAPAMRRSRVIPCPSPPLRRMALSPIEVCVLRT